MRAASLTRQLCLAAVMLISVAPFFVQAQPSPHAPAASFEGFYRGDALLIDGQGDCNTGGTGSLRITVDQGVFSDARNGRLEGPIGSDGLVDLRVGRIRLLGGLQEDTFSVVVTGGPCEYEFLFTRQAEPDSVADAVSRRDSAAPGLSFFVAGRYAEALQVWTMAAEGGDARAALFVGMMYDTAQGVGHDEHQAVT